MKNEEYLLYPYPLNMFFDYLWLSNNGISVWEGFFEDSKRGLLATDIVVPIPRIAEFGNEIDINWSGRSVICFLTGILIKMSTCTTQMAFRAIFRSIISSVV